MTEKIRMGVLKWLKNQHPQIIDIVFLTDKRWSYNTLTTQYNVVVYYIDHPPAITDYDYDEFVSEMWRLMISMQKYLNCDINHVSAKPQHKNPIPIS